MIMRLCVMVSLAAAAANFIVHDTQVSSLQRQENARGQKLDHESRRCNERYRAYRHLRASDSWSLRSATLGGPVSHYNLGDDAGTIRCRRRAT